MKRFEWGFVWNKISKNAFNNSLHGSAIAEVVEASTSWSQLALGHDHGCLWLCKRRATNLKWTTAITKTWFTTQYSKGRAQQSVQNYCHPPRKLSKLTDNWIIKWFHHEIGRSEEKSRLSPQRVRANASHTSRYTHQMIVSYESMRAPLSLPISSRSCIITMHKNMTCAITELRQL